MPAGPLILIVEHDPAVREMLAFVLEHRGYRVCTASDYAGGAKRLADEPPDLLISDVLLFGGSGKALAEIARSMSIPVVFTTVGPSAERLLVDDPAPYFPKPFRLADLEREIERLLPRQPTRAAR